MCPYHALFFLVSHGVKIQSWVILSGGWGGGMPINRLLRSSKLDPDKVELLNRAFDLALRSLGLVDRNDPMTELVAEKVIEVHELGVNDPTEIADIAVRRIGT
jgi:hypothetical protein